MKTPAPVEVKVCLILMDPILPAEAGARLRQVMRWNDPDHLVEGFISDLRSASYGYANYTVAEKITVDDFPLFEDGFLYTGEEYLQGWRLRLGFHNPDKVDYDQFITDHDLAGRIERGEADEIWMIDFQQLVGVYSQS